MLIKVRFQFPEIVFGMLLAVAVFALGMTFESSVSSVNQPSAEHGDQSNKQPKNESAENSKKTQSLWTPTDSVGLYTLVLAFFTGVLACVSIFQGVMLVRADKTSRITANATNLNAQAAVRAEQAHVYPSIEQENIVEMIRLWGRSEEDRSEIQGIGVSYCLKNVGRTPAILIVAGAELVHGHISDRPEGTVGITSFVAIDKILTTNDSTEPPSIVSLPNFSAADARSVLAGQTTLWFHSYVDYQDVIGLNRRLEYWWWYNGNLPRFGWHSFRGGESRPQNA